jgi:Fur family ferric uptake transcriptional regulator
MERCVPRRRKALGRTRENFEGSSEPEVLRRYLSDHGLKMTTQREKILEVFLETQGHVTAEQLYDRLKRIDPSIGFTTVYRSLRLLCACGLAQERSFGHGPTRYENAYTRHHHDHLVCVKCGRIIEFENESIEEIQKEVARTHRFELLDHRHELYGHCEACRMS